MLVHSNGMADQWDSARDERRLPRILRCIEDPLEYGDDAGKQSKSNDAFGGVGDGRNAVHCCRSEMRLNYLEWRFAKPVRLSNNCVKVTRGL